MGIIDEHVSADLAYQLEPAEVKANALRLSGIMTLAPGMELGATNALNGDKIIAIDPIDTTEVSLRMRYKLGGGLGSLKVERLD